MLLIGLPSYFSFLFSLNGLQIVNASMRNVYIHLIKKSVKNKTQKRTKEATLLIRLSQSFKSKEKTPQIEMSL